jgi:hypothetical protein
MLLRRACRPFAGTARQPEHAHTPLLTRLDVYPCRRRRRASGQLRAIAESNAQEASTKSSLTALYTAIPWHEVWISVCDLYWILAASVTSGKIPTVARVQLALFCGGVVKEDALSLLGPYFDP